jgi:radical SAM/Cys-rich protein
MTNFENKILEIQSEPLRSNGIKILQLNLGYKCNMTCKHCHIEAGPHRDELMGKDVIDMVLNIIKKHDIGILDLTGGAPELNPHMKYLVQEAWKLNSHIIARSNLTVFFEDGMEDYPEFYSEHDVEIIASLPHYTKESVDRVRGNETFRKSIEALRKLNTLGYGTSRQLHLVYNPMGAFLPSSQKELEEQYKKELYSNFNIIFNHLYTFANMPIGRFKEFLVRTNNLSKYTETIQSAFNPVTLDGLMCRHLISVGWDGTLYDCDFNQVLGLTVDIDCPDHIREFNYALLAERKIVTDEHCFACTAGQGST